MRFYVSGALQGSQNLATARSVYELAGKAIKSAGAEAYVPHMKTDPVANFALDSHSVFRTDLEQIKNSDGLVVFLNEPSLGVGAEIAIALSLGKILLPLVESGRDFSRFVGGLLEANGAHPLRYSSLDELQSIIRTNVLEQLNPNNTNHLRSAI